MILDKTRTRRAYTRRTLLIALIPATAALVTLAVLRPTAKAQTVPHFTGVSPVAAPSSQPPMKFTFTRVAMSRNANGEMIFSTSPDLKLNDTTLFAGVTDAGKPGSPWWSASGTTLPTPVYETAAYSHRASAPPSEKRVSFAFRLPAALTGATVRYELPRSLGSSSDGTWPTKMQGNADTPKPRYSRIPAERGS